MSSSLEDDIWLYFTPEGNFDQNTPLHKTEGGLAKALWRDIEALLRDYRLKALIIGAHITYQYFAKKKLIQKTFLEYLLETHEEKLRGTALLPHGIDIETAKNNALEKIAKTRAWIENINKSNPFLLDFEKEISKLDDTEEEGA